MSKEHGCFFVPCGGLPTTRKCFAYMLIRCFFLSFFLFFIFYFYFCDTALSSHFFILNCITLVGYEWDFLKRVYAVCQWLQTYIYRLIGAHNTQSIFITRPFHFILFIHLLLSTDSIISDAVINYVKWTKEKEIVVKILFNLYFFRILAIRRNGEKQKNVNCGLKTCSICIWFELR